MSASRAARWLGPSAGPLVFYFIDLQSHTRVLRVLGAYNEEALERRLAGFPHGLYKRLDIKIHPVPFHLALRDFKILGGVPSNSEEQGSSAIYWAECDLGDYAYKIYTLPGRRTTSPHHHNKIEESFFWVAGGPPIVKLGQPTFEEGEKALRLRGGRFVPTGVDHQLVTEEAEALILIEMVGPDPLGMSDHHYASVG